MDDALTIVEAAHRAGLSYGQVWRRVIDGKLGPGGVERRHGRWYVLPVGMEALIRSAHHPQPSVPVVVQYDGGRMWRPMPDVAREHGWSYMRVWTTVVGRRLLASEARRFGAGRGQWYISDLGEAMLRDLLDRPGHPGVPQP